MPDAVADDLADAVSDDLSADGAAPRSRSILFVCTGNICRSPTAHGLLLHKAQEAGIEVEVDSAGTSTEEIGSRPDRRAQLIAKKRGFALPEHRARQIRAVDFERFDLIIGMTRQHDMILRRRAGAERLHKVHMLMTFTGDGRAVDVPDPWWGEIADFEIAFDMIEQGVDGVLRTLAGGPPAK